MTGGALVGIKPTVSAACMAIESSDGEGKSEMEGRRDERAARWKGGEMKGRRDGREARWRGGEMKGRRETRGEG